MRNRASETIDRIHLCCWHGLRVELGSETAGLPSTPSTHYVTVCEPTLGSRSPIPHMGGEETLPLQQLSGREDGLRMTLAMIKETKGMQDVATG